MIGINFVFVMVNWKPNSWAPCYHHLGSTLNNYCMYPNKCSIRLNCKFHNEVIINVYHLCYLAPNECDLFSPCHENATCMNTEQSFTCQCISSYTGDGINCVG